MNRVRSTKRFLKNSVMLMAIIMFWMPLQAQVVKTMTFTGEEGDIFMLQEIGGLIIESDDGPKIEMVMPADHRLEDYKMIDLQAGDIIKMFNGKSTKTVASIIEIYEALAIGDDVKFGVKRGKDMFIEKFVKMDAKNAPQQMMITKSFDSDDGNIGSIGNIITDLLDLGLLMDENDGTFSVLDVITEIESVFEGTQPENGDKLIKIQSSKINSAKELTQIYGDIKVGEKAALTMLRDGKEIILKFEKPKAGAGGPIKIMRKQGH